MADADVTTSSRTQNNGLTELLECSICQEAFNDPRQLPCIHTFCFGCLEKLRTSNQNKNEVICPFCRRTWKLPSDGVYGLPKNFFVEKVREVTNILMISRSRCEICASEEEPNELQIGEDLFYCIDCRQRICGQCCKNKHNKFRVFKNHQLIDLKNGGRGDDFNELSRKFDKNMCDDHESETVKMFCLDCELAICMICYVETHSRHKCSDVNKVCEEFREQLRQNIELVSVCIKESADIQHDLEHKSDHLFSDIASCELGVVEVIETLTQLINSHAGKLRETLSNLKMEKQKESETIRLEIENHLTTLESYSRYTNEVKDKGSNKDICRSVSDLIARVKDLELTHKSFVMSHSSSNIESGVVFVPSKLKNGWISGEEGNIIGKLVCKAFNNEDKTESIDCQIPVSESQIRELNDQLELAKKEICRLKEENFALKSEIGGSINRAESNNSNMNEYEKQLKQSRAKSDELGRRLRTVLEQKLNAEEKLRKFKENVDKCFHEKVKLLKLKKKVVSMKNENCNMRRHCIWSRDQISIQFQQMSHEVTLALECLKKKINTLEVENKRQAKQISVQLSDLHSSERIAEIRERAFKEKCLLEEKLQQRNDQLAYEIKDLKAQMSEMRSKLISEKERANASAQELASTIGANQKLTRRMQKMYTVKTEQADELTRLKRINGDLEVRLHRLEEQQAHLKIKHTAELEQIKDKWINEVESMNMKLRESEMNRRHMEEELSKLRKNTKELPQKYADEGTSV